MWLKRVEKEFLSIYQTNPIFKASSSVTVVGFLALIDVRDKTSFSLIIYSVRLFRLLFSHLFLFTLLIFLFHSAFSHKVRFVLDRESFVSIITLCKQSFKLTYSKKVCCVWEQWAKNNKLCARVDSRTVPTMLGGETSTRNNNFPHEILLLFDEHSAVTKNFFNFFSLVFYLV